VPSSRAAARSRGGDHVLRLARAVARQAQLPVLSALTLAGPVRDSAGLSAEQRRTNLAGRMAVPVPAELAGRCPILLDDIVTTGATLAEAGRALSAAGRPAGGAAVIAATRLRRTSGSRPVGVPRAPPVVGETGDGGVPRGVGPLQLGRSARKG
jgi:predicted amidophosphoribosyltransferase